MDLAHPQAAWKTIVPEQTEAIETVALIGGCIVAQYLVDVQSRLRLFGLDGERAGRRGAARAWAPCRASAAAVTRRTSGTASRRRSCRARSIATIRRPRQSTAFEAAAPPIDAAQYETLALFASSKDGTRVPFFLTAKKDLPRNGSMPTMLYGYGGFSISVLPAYRADVPAWLELGGAFVTVNLRGGAEYGEAWHKAGYLEKKQNVFDDFIAVAEYLVKEKYTSPATLGMMGGSNGGLLVGAVMEQRPDLFAVALPAVGVMDMLRYDRFTGGRLWATEYGTSQDPEQFAFLIEYSPLHNLKAGHVLSGHAGDHGGPRRPRRAEPLVQVHRGVAGGAGLRQARADPRGDAGLPRLPPHGQADRGARGPVGVRRGAHGSKVGTPT